MGSRITATPLWVFGYGSLLQAGAAVPHRRARLLGARRRWAVAMDNAATIPGYKCYRDPATGQRPDVFVTFLDLADVPGSVVTGLLLPVAPETLPALDRRERNYRRVDVGDRIDPPVRGRVVTYAGTPQGRARFRRGRRRGSAVVAQPYLDRVVAGFTALGGRSLADFGASTDPLPCPVRPLERIDLPA